MAQNAEFDKRQLEFVLTDQQAELEIKRSEKYCSRIEEHLIDLDSPQAQVVIGVRRSGKSTLCFQRLEHAGVKYAYVDFDDERLRGLDANHLNDILEILYKVYGDFNYLFLDEIQDVDGWHLFVNRLLRIKMHVIITGSNAKLLSSELASHLTGRANEIHLYPLSFDEYCAIKGVDCEKKTTKAVAMRRAAFDDYVNEGGFPELLNISNKHAYINTLVNNILRRDIEQRYSITYKASFELMAQHLLNVSPAIIAPKELANTFNIRSEQTVRNYINYLLQAYMMVGINKYSQKSKLRITRQKVYAIDVAMMNRRDNAFAAHNLGWRLETIVLLRLLRECQHRGYDIYYINERSGECDFVVCNNNKTVQAIQVSYDMTNVKTRARELKGLLLANKLTRCDNLLILTDHEHADIEHKGHQIAIRPVYEWSLGDIL